MSEVENILCILKVIKVYSFKLILTKTQPNLLCACTITYLIKCLINSRMIAYFLSTVIAIFVVKSVFWIISLRQIFKIIKLACGYRIFKVNVAKLLSRDVLLVSI